MTHSRVVAFTLALLAAPSAARADAYSVTAQGAAQLVAGAQGPRVIFVWSTSCPPCMRVLPEFEKRAQAWQRAGISVFSLSIDDDPSRLAAFAAERTRSVHHYWIQPWQPGELTRALRSVGVEIGASIATPLFAAIDPAGRRLGQRTGADALKLVDKWLGAKGDAPQGPLIIEVR